MLTITCPSCSRKLQVPDNAAGKQVRCPLCNHMFQAEGQPAASSPPTPTPIVPPPDPIMEAPSPPGEEPARRVATQAPPESGPGGLMTITCPSCSCKLQV